MGIDKIFAVKCIPNMPYVVIKGANSENKNGKMIILRTGRFTRMDRRIAAVYDLDLDATNPLVTIGFHFGLHKSNPQITYGVQNLLSNDNYLILNHFANNSYQFFYYDLTGPNILYNATGSDHSMEIKKTFVQSNGELNNILEFSTDLQDVSSKFQYKKIKDYKLDQISNHTLQMNQIMDITGPYKGLRLQIPEKIKSKVGFSPNMEKISPPTNTTQNVTFDYISGAGDYITGITNSPCTSNKNCNIKKQQSLLSIYDIKQNKLLLDNMELKKHAASDIHTIQSDDGKFLVSVILFPNYQSSYPLSDVTIGVTQLPQSADAGVNFKLKEVGPQMYNFSIRKAM